MRRERPDARRRQESPSLFTPSSLIGHSRPRAVDNLNIKHNIISTLLSQNSESRVRFPADTPQAPEITTDGRVADRCLRRFSGKSKRVLVPTRGHDKQQITTAAWLNRRFKSGTNERRFKPRQLDSKG